MKKLDLGTILSYSWGYEQTNVDFYQVVKVTKKTVMIREIGSELKLDGYMSGYRTPMFDNFTGEPIRKFKKDYNADECVSMDYGVATIWNGSPERVSFYA